MSSPATERSEEIPETPIALAEFLETVPPNTEVVVGHTITKWYLQVTSIRLFCPSEECGIETYFDTNQEGEVFDRPPVHRLFTYTCRHCKTTTKDFALAIWREGIDLRILKIGEHPSFGPILPSRLVTLVGSDRDFLLKGRKAEAFGLGIAAYAYYRRVVENQKDRLFEKIIKVAEKIGAEPRTVTALKTAKREKQFTKAFGMAKDAIPAALQVAGHNPLLVLHNALSDGIHGRTDKECLDLAATIRKVLIRLADKINDALRDEAELRSAIGALTIREQEREKTTGKASSKSNDQTQS